MAYCQNCGTSVDEADGFCVSCGTALEAVGEPERDQSVRLGNYSLVGEIGRGATGIVYLATDSQSGRQVALKVLDPILSGIPGYPERLRSESAVLSHLSDPHLVATYGMDEDQGHLFLVTEFVEGASLRVVEQNAGRLTPEQSLGIMAGVLEGLGLVHAHGLVHGDVKPENILVDRTGTSKLVDFGQVVNTGSTTLGGTPSYMSPESVRGQAIDARSDLYSMGVVLYEALAGHRPFVADNDLATLRMHAEADPPPVEGLGTHTSALLGWALAKNPDGRPQSAGVFLAELEAAAAADYGEDWKKRAVGGRRSGRGHHRRRGAGRSCPGGSCHRCHLPGTDRSSTDRSDRPLGHLRWAPRLPPGGFDRRRRPACGRRGRRGAHPGPPGRRHPNPVDGGRLRQTGDLRHRRTGGMRGHRCTRLRRRPLCDALHARLHRLPTMGARAGTRLLHGHRPAAQRTGGPQ